MSTYCYELRVEDSDAFPMIVFGLHDIKRVESFDHEDSEHAPEVKEQLVEAIINDTGKIALLNQLANPENQSFIGLDRR